MAFIIYKCTNTINNRVYIGATCQGIETRKRQHLEYNLKTRFGVALHASSSDIFVWDTVETVQTAKDAAEREMYWIDQLDSLDPAIGYNSTRGGYRGGNESWVDRKAGATISSDELRNAREIERKKRELERIANLAAERERWRLVAEAIRKAYVDVFFETMNKSNPSDSDKRLIADHWATVLLRIPKNRIIEFGRNLSRFICLPGKQIGNITMTSKSGVVSVYNVAEGC
jgi:hypothetical protein